MRKTVTFKLAKFPPPSDILTASPTLGVAGKVILTGLALVSTWTFSPAVIAKSAFLYVTVGCAPCNVLKTKFPAPSVATASPAVAAFVVLRFDAVTDSFEIRLVVF